MKSEWKELTIDELKADKRNAISMGPFGSKIKAENFVNEGIPIIKGGNLNGDFIDESHYDYLTEEKANELRASNAFPLDIVITHRGTIGQVGLIPKNSKFDRYVVSQSQLKVSLDQKKINPYYVYYFFKSKLGQHRLLMNASQVGVPAIAQASTSVKKILVPHPSIKDQNKIVNILLALDDKIELNRKMNQTLEAMTQALFKSWFVDFDPVHAKSKCSSDEELKVAAKELGISKEILDLFPSEFEDSDLGMIPKGWKTIKFNEIASVRKGLSYKGKHKSDNTDDVPMFNLGNFGRSGQYRPEKIAYYNGDYKERHLIRAGQLMIANTDMTQDRIILGLPLLVPKLVEKDMIFTHHVFAIDFQSVELESKLKYYIFYTFLNPKFREIAEGYATGTTVLALPKDGIMNFNLLLSSENIIESFNHLVHNLVNKMTINKSEIETLQKTRDTLLPKLLSGELNVSELELDTDATENEDPKHIFDIYKEKFGEPFDIYGLYWDDMEKQTDLALQCIEEGKVIWDILSKEELELIEEAKQGNIVF